MRGRTRFVLAGAALLLILAIVFLDYYVKTLAPRLKKRIVAALEQRFDAEVQLNDLQFSIFPLPSVDGQGLSIAHKDWPGDKQPLIKIQHFHAETDFTTILDWRNRVNRVRLDGLEIHIPPRGRAMLNAKTEGTQQVSSDEPGHDPTRLKFLIETIVADNSSVEIEPKEAGKDPLKFPIERLTMRSVGLGQAMAFTARLKNAMPPGDIDTSGHFGPWQRDDPRATPISGDYTFQNANLSVFNGIRGILSSQGKYGGVLQHIEVNGWTDTPDFGLKQGGAAVHLTSNFHSIVDATNGDTILDPVDAKFGHSEFVCTGGIVHHPGEPGKTVELDARTKQGRMEDILTLVVQGAPILKGEMDFQSKIVIPPGKQQVVDKLKLDGMFHLKSGVFASQKVEKVLRTLSDRATGFSKAEESRGEGGQGKVASDFFGKFRVGNGVASFPTLAFGVPGARIQLAGRYNLNSSQIDMKGVFQMQATLSQTQSGVKELLLKPLDRFFEKNGAGFEVPISVSGTRDHPSVGVTAFHKHFDIH